MNKFYTYLILSLSVIFTACNTSEVQQSNHQKNIVYKDLDSIKTIGTLKALLEYSPTSYFIYKGNPMGFEYELLKKYAKHIDVELEIIPIKNMDSIFVNLNNGLGDIIAANLAITEERLIETQFTHPVLITQQVLIQRKPEGWRKLRKADLKKQLLQSPLDLVDKTVTISKESSFYSRIKSLSNEIGGKIHINTVSGEISMEELIEKVATQEIEYTIADKNLAIVSQWQYSNIDANLTISLDQKIAWSTRKNSQKLTHSINEWLIEFQKTKKFKILYNKYFKNQKGFNQRIKHEYYTLTSGEISPFDEILQQQAKKINWDWELLAAMIYQESHFNNSARGWGNSFGLMQFMPKTGAQYGVDTNSTAQENIIAGVNYIKYLNKYWEPIIPDTTQRIRFVLASYNVGPGHLLDARRLAEKYGKDAFIWDNNVDFFLLNKSKAKYYKDEVVRHGYCKGFITYNYVNEIITRYEHYKNMSQLQQALKNKQNEEANLAKL
ncbi:MAG: transporter substrate-binding domain-containing protein [Flavobacteriales bacterium]|nr:transporter substrate-binding domain-containing protein [Flavobacteriales bacterium]